MEPEAVVTHIVVLFSVVWATDQDDVHDEPWSALNELPYPLKKG